jgi:hypothetical protein
LNLRIQYAKLASALINKGGKENKAKAVEVLDRVVAGLPEYNVKYETVMAQFADLYYQAGAKEKGENLARRMEEIYSEIIEYSIRHQADFSGALKNEFDDGIRVLGSLYQTVKNYGDSKYADALYAKLKQYDADGVKYAAARGGR